MRRVGGGLMPQTRQPAKKSATRKRAVKGACVRAIDALWARAKQLGVDEGQWRAAYVGALVAAKSLDEGGMAGNALASVVTAFRQYETELRGEVAELKRGGEDNTPEQVRLIQAVRVAEAERVGAAGAEVRA